MAKKRAGKPGWWGEPIRHSRAAKKGWRKRKAKMREMGLYNIDSGLFKPPAHEEIAEVVSFETPEKAQLSASLILNGLERGRFHGREVNREYALTLARALQYAANRAKAALKRKNLSQKEKRELKAVHKIYKAAAEKAWELYHDKYKVESVGLYNVSPSIKELAKKAKKAGVIKKVNKQTPVRVDIERDMKREALPPGWRISKSGRLYYEDRANRSDLDGKL